MALVQKTYYITSGYIEQIGGIDVYFRGFSQSSNGLDVPADPIHANVGDTVRVTIINTRSQTHAFKIDGIVDSGNISGGQTKVVEFDVDEPGTFMFYDDTNFPYNRLVGLHGGMAVHPSSDELYPGSPKHDQEYFWIFNDIDPYWHDRIRRNRSINTPFNPSYFTINGRNGRPPGAPDDDNYDVNSMKALDTVLHGHVGDRTLVRMINAGLCTHSVHTHANHMEWLSHNGEFRSDIWKKDILRLDNDMGITDMIFPFESPPDAWPPVSTGMYPMHLHDEMTQTAAGGYYMFGALTDIMFE